MTDARWKEMLEMREKCVKFVVEVSTPIKKQHSEEIKSYLEKFITFPGGLAIASVFFTSSSLVKTESLAISGAFLIIGSLLVALNVLRAQIHADKSFNQKIGGIVKPMVEFSRLMTLFSNSVSRDNEAALLESRLTLDKMYFSRPLRGDENSSEKTGNPYLYIDISFVLLAIGIILSFLSLFKCG